jgi:hypothetical protein
MRAYTSPLWADYWEGERKLYEQYREIIKPEKEVDIDLDNKCIKIDGVFYRLVTIDENEFFNTVTHLAEEKQLLELKKQANDVAMKEEKVYVVKLDKLKQWCMNNGSCGKVDMWKMLEYFKPKVGEKLITVADAEITPPPQSEVSKGDGFVEKDYEIKSFKGNDDNFWVDFYDNGIYSCATSPVKYNLSEALRSSELLINRVKRLIDGVMFSVGDETDYGKIKEFCDPTTTAFEGQKVAWFEEQNDYGKPLSMLSKKPSTTNEQNEEDFINKINDGSRVVYSEKKSEPTLTDKTISYQELKDFIMKNKDWTDILTHFEPKSKS